MEDDEYRRFLFEIPLGFAHHKVIYNEENIPIDYTFLEVNDEFGKITGLGTTSIIGKNISEVLPDLITANFDWINFYGNLAKRKGKADFEQYSEPLKKWFKVYVSSTEYGYFTTLFTDISQRRTAFEDLNRKKNLFAILLELSQDIKEYTLDELIQKTLDFAEEQTNSIIAFYHFIEDDQNTVSLQTWSTNTLLNMCKAMGQGIHYPIEKAGVWGDSIRMKETIIVNDYDHYHIKYGLPAGHAPIHRFISMPVIRNEKVVAVIGVGNKSSDYTKEDVEILREISETLWNIISQKRNEQKVIEAQKKMELVLDNINSVVYITDVESYEILYINEYGKKQVGSNALGDKCYKKIYLNNEPCKFCSNKHFFKSNNKDKNNEVSDIIESLRSLHQNKEASYFYEVYNEIENKWFEIKDTFIQWFDGRSVKLSVAADITERKNAENSLKDFAEHLQLLNDTKDKFFSIISHDLKNPLGSFRQITSLLFNDYHTFSDTDRLELLQAIKDSSSSIYNLLENLLEWSKSQRGVIDYKPIETNLSKLVNDNIEIVSQSAINKSIKIYNYIPNDFVAHLDVNLMNTVIRNLLSNAIKFSLAGSKIEVGLIPNTKSTIFVRDYGVGMSEKQLSALFQIDKSKSTLGTAHEKGSGLGLILCKEFIEKHNGTIKVESHVNEGTTFIIELGN